MAWTFFDVAVAGSLLLGFGTVYMLVTRKVSSRRNRIIVGVTIAAVLLLVWVELAVGIFGSALAGS